MTSCVESRRYMWGRSTRVLGCSYEAHWPSTNLSLVEHMHFKMQVGYARLLPVAQLHCRSETPHYVTRLFGVYGSTRTPRQPIQNFTKKWSI
jgi:hypothetical protein